MTEMTKIELEIDKRIKHLPKNIIIKTLLTPGLKMFELSYFLGKVRQFLSNILYAVESRMGLYLENQQEEYEKKILKSF